MRAGSGLFLGIKDPHTLYNPEGGSARIWDKSELYYLLETVEAAGVDDGGIDDTDPSELSFTSLIERRMRFVQKPDEGRAEALKAAGKNPKRVVTKDGKTREYDYTRLAVEAVYPPVQATVVKHVVKPTTAVKKTGNGALKENVVTGEPLDQITDGILLAILKANGGSVQRTQLVQNVLKMAAKGDINMLASIREPLRKRIFEEDYLLRQNGWSFDQGGKKQIISLSDDIPF